MIYRIAFIGPQGCGKGTQAVQLAKHLGIPQITPGAIYRQEIAAGTERGNAIAPIVNAGGMVPDEISNALVAERVGKPDCTNGFILDGYPRTMVQVHAIDEHIGPLTHVFFLDIDDETAVDRLANRLVCICGIPYPGKEIAIDPGQETRCTECKGQLQKRPDDNPDAVRKRLQIYHERTEPIIAEYRTRGVLIPIDGTRSIGEVYQEILEKVTP
ncbi:MAG: nucleoside monophosphate kinase [bacterium]|nr:nucleoside monophosphate kinase [bacterium]